MKAKKRDTGEYVAIKYISDIFKNTTETKMLVAELQIMNQFSNQDGNIFTPKLFDVIFCPRMQESYLFVVMEYITSDLKKVLSSTPGIDFAD